MVPPAGAAAATTTRVSVATNGTQAKTSDPKAAISGDGRYVAFTSTSGNLVPGDTNRLRDVFVHDRATATTTRVSVASDGSQGTSDAYVAPDISGDGRYVAFVSYAPNLVTGDTNGKGDVFVHDRLTATTSRVSVSSTGKQAKGFSRFPRITPDGRYVAFDSDAPNLVVNDQNGGERNVFVHDRFDGATTIASIASDGRQVYNLHGEFGLSNDGRFVVFSSTEQATPNDLNNDPALAGDPSNTHSYYPVADIFVHDRLAGATTLVSVSSTGLPGNAWSYDPSISGDGRFVAFGSGASTLVPGDTNADEDVFVHDRQTGSTTRVSQSSLGVGGISESRMGDISNDGRHVAFYSAASNLVLGDNNGRLDIFVHDRETGEVARVSVSTAGEEGSGSCFWPAINTDGGHIVFASSSPNLVPGDTNGQIDLFVRER